MGSTALFLEPVKISLNNVRMKVVRTSPNGVVNESTLFTFKQLGNVVSAEYEGGLIKKGFLVGRSDGLVLKFSYCQLQVDNVVDSGVSICVLSANDRGKITLTERFEWKSRPGEFGTNVFEEVTSEAGVKQNGSLLKRNSSLSDN
jgi:hypothetical protein